MPYDYLECYDIEKQIYDSELFNKHFIKGDYSLVFIQDQVEDDIRYVTIINKANCYNEFKFLALMDRAVRKYLDFYEYSYCEINLGCSYVFACQMGIHLIKNTPNLFGF